MTAQQIALLELLFGFALLACLALVCLSLLVAVIYWPIREWRLYRRTKNATYALENGRPGYLDVGPTGRKRLP